MRLRVGSLIPVTTSMGLHLLSIAWKYHIVYVSLVHCHLYKNYLVKCYSSPVKHAVLSICARMAAFTACEHTCIHPLLQCLYLGEKLLLAELDGIKINVIAHLS